MKSMYVYEFKCKNVVQKLIKNLASRKFWLQK